MIGLNNANLAVYVRPAGAARPLSIQLFDDTRLFLVNVASRPPGQSRDVLLTAREVVGLFDDYYDELWAACAILVNGGRADAAQIEKVLRG